MRITTKGTAAFATPLTPWAQSRALRHHQRPSTFSAAARNRAPITRCPPPRATNRACASPAAGDSLDPQGDVALDAATICRVQRRTLAWMRDIVIPLDLCPFARGVVTQDAHRITVSPSRTGTAVYATVSDEISHLVATPAAVLATTLVVFPNFAVADFALFNEVAAWIETAVESDESLVDLVMLACFHPRHEWGDAAGCDDPVNFDKRAPYPIVNLLRAPDVDKYAEQGLTQNILENNRQRLNRVGTQRLKQMYDDL